MQVSFKPITFTSRNDDITIKKSEISAENEEKTPSLSQRKRAWRHGLYAGMMIGSLMGGGVVDCYHSNQSEALLEDLKKEIATRDLYQIKVDTFNNGTPGIILEDKNGDKDIYDIVSHDIYRKFGSTLEEEYDW